MSLGGTRLEPGKRFLLEGLISLRLEDRRLVLFMTLLHLLLLLVNGQLLLLLLEQVFKVRCLRAFGRLVCALLLAGFIICPGFLRCAWAG